MEYEKPRWTLLKSRWYYRRSVYTFASHEAPVAQLDRALPSGGKGQRFESSRARHSNSALLQITQYIAFSAQFQKSAMSVQISGSQNLHRISKMSLSKMEQIVNVRKGKGI